MLKGRLCLFCLMLGADPRPVGGRGRKEAGVCATLASHRCGWPGRRGILEGDEHLWRCGRVCPQRLSTYEEEAA